jgi:hypothetical protein
MPNFFRSYIIPISIALLSFFSLYYLYIAYPSSHPVWVGCGIFALQLTSAILTFWYARSDNSKSSPWIGHGVLLLTTIIAISHLYKVKQAVQRMPITVAISDVVPQIDTMASRALQGKYPYQPIHFTTPAGKYQMNPTYMPLQWMPYMVSAWCQLDTRWFAVLLFWLALWIAFRYTVYTGQHPLQLFAASLLLYLPWLIFEREEVLRTVESGVAIWYLLIPIFLYRRNYYLVTLLVTACLLSRYSILFWVPLYFLVLFIDQRAHFWKHVGILIAGVLLLYVIPFLSTDPMIFIKAWQYHHQATLGEWQHLNERNVPYHLFDGQGLASVFYKLPFGSLPAKIQALQVAMLLAILILLGSATYLLLKRPKKIALPFNTTSFLIGTLMVYLVILYSFSQIPYKYLFVVPVSVLLSGWMVLPLIEYQKK